MIQFTSGRQNADFGNLGANSTPDLSADGSGGGGNAQSPVSSGGLLNSLVGSVTGGVGGDSGSLCGCANKDQQAESAKKNELSAKYPVRDCTGLTGTALSDCNSFNTAQKAKQDAEYNAWVQAKDQSVGASLPPSDQQRFAFVSSLAQQLKAAHPEAGGMTLSQIYKSYPDDFDKIYASLQAQYPFLKNIDAQTALAMNPGVANMTLDQLIAKTTALAGPAASSSGSSLSSSATGGLVAAGIAALGLLVWMKRR